VLDVTDKLIHTCFRWFHFISSNIIEYEQFTNFT